MNFVGKYVLFIWILLLSALGHTAPDDTGKDPDISQLMACLKERFFISPNRTSDGAGEYVGWGIKSVQETESVNLSVSGISRDGTLNHLKEATLERPEGEVFERAEMLSNTLVHLLFGVNGKEEEEGEPSDTQYDDSWKGGQSYIWDLDASEIFMVERDDFYRVHLLTGKRNDLGAIMAEAYGPKDPSSEIKTQFWHYNLTTRSWGTYPIFSSIHSNVQLHYVGKGEGRTCKYVSYKTDEEVYVYTTNPTDRGTINLDKLVFSQADANDCTVYPKKGLVTFTLHWGSV